MSLASQHLYHPRRRFLGARVVPVNTRSQTGAPESGLILVMSTGGGAVQLGSAADFA